MDDTTKRIAQGYLAGIRNPFVRCMGAPQGSESNWHLFPVLAPAGRKSAFIDYLKSNGIESGEHYPAIIPEQPAMVHVAFELADDCSTARAIASAEVSLPIHPYLTDEEVARVVETVNSWKGGE